MIDYSLKNRFLPSSNDDHSGMPERSEEGLVRRSEERHCRHHHDEQSDDEGGEHDAADLPTLVRISVEGPSVWSSVRISVPTIRLLIRSSVRLTVRRWGRSDNDNWWRGRASPWGWTPVVVSSEAVTMMMMLVMMTMVMHGGNALN
jgi:hypothetical protein